MKKLIIILLTFLPALTNAQLVINEGSNKNFNSILDGDEESEDWIEIYNTADYPINLNGYFLTDDEENLQKWEFSTYFIQPQEFLIVFCSGKDIQPVQVFQDVAYVENYVPHEGWNYHEFEDPFYWDGESNVILDVCSYYNDGYTNNSRFHQTETEFGSTLTAVNDGGDASCDAYGGDVHFQRPNTRFNYNQIGDDDVVNCNTCYPAPYGNWYSAARNQMLFKAEELEESGLTEGEINQIGWDVEYTSEEQYTYISIKMKHVDIDQLTGQFANSQGGDFHTNFKIDSGGENILLVSPDLEIESELFVDVPSIFTSRGSIPNGSNNISFLTLPSPGESNDDSFLPEGVCSEPIISTEGGVYQSTLQVDFINTGDDETYIFYTTNGDEPNLDSELYTGESINVFQSSNIRARAFKDGYIPSQIVSETYLLNVSHITPIVAISIEDDHLYAGDGIFENWWEDWERFAQISVFDSTQEHNHIFDRNVAMQIDGGAGGSRSNPQHSFRLEMAKGAFDEEPVELSLLSNRPERDTYSRLYFRNGSNHWLNIPYKDACLVDMLTTNTFAYHSAMRPASVYINGEYFGLYEMREKLDAEFWAEYDDYDDYETVDVLSQSYWYDLILRATDGQVDDYYIMWEEFQQLNPESPGFLTQANTYYDLENYTDYIISQSWIANYDWPYNNIKLYRSDASDLRWRFATIDLELSLQPGGWSDCYDNGLQHVRNEGENSLFVGAWNRCYENNDYRVYFINRFADLNNTLYKVDRLLSIEQSYFDEWSLEMPKEFARWGDPWNVQGQMNEFFDRHIHLQEEIECKTEVVRDQIEDVLDLDGQFDLYLDALPAGAGVIHLNTIKPTEYPWEGLYYKGIPIEMTAVANEGYEFIEWVSAPQIDDDLNPYWTGETYNNSLSFTALFEETAEHQSVAEADNSFIEVFPNPTTDFLFIKTPESKIQSWEIYNSQGSIVDAIVNRALDRQISLDIGQLSTGVYSIIIKTEHGASVKHWVKL